MTDSARNEEPSDYIGCCGAYCRTCRVLAGGLCRGCKLGYLDGQRDIAKAKCRMKVCCVQRGLVACGECPELDTCPTMAAFFNHASYKYRKYREATEFIRRYGCAEFLKQADTWTGAYGKLEPPHQ
ncbi:MAG: DUF3795 domain-containing protein [Dehalococcoidia bacterium]|jgi:hypothetical protein|nr:DUF3795 domain-containing protein [Dehalococcoidia bacterium]